MTAKARHFPDRRQTTFRLLRDCSGIVEDGIRHGKTLDQLKQEKVLAKYDKWGGSFITTDRFLETLYHDLSGDKSKMGFVTHN